MRIAIIGAGHAGVEAALAARKTGAEVTLFSNESLPPYFRPRLVALAFGQVERDAILMHPASWYAAQGIDLRLDSRVTAFDPAARRVATKAGIETFDAVVLANGARPVRIELPDAPPGLPILSLWNVTEAELIRSRLKPGRRITVLGGGILGIETALRAREVGQAVTLIERNDRLMPAQFAPDGSALLQRLIEARGIVVRTGIAATGAELEGDFAVLTIGARPDVSLAETAGLPVDRGLVVDAQLQTPYSRVFAAGDLAQYPGPARPCVREAVAQGKVSGANAAAAVAGEKLQPHRPQLAPLTFKEGELELASAGNPGGENAELRLLTDETLPHTYRALVLRNGRLEGVQMIGVRKAFDTWTARLGEPYR